MVLTGKTVEINNPDAEGRLILADGVAYAEKKLGSDVIFDVATLTGAQGPTTGKYHGAILSNSAVWEAKVLKAGRITGDCVFPIVYCPELHLSEFNSEIADMKNSVADYHNATSSCAGLFIASHLSTKFSGSWVHIDMAATVASKERATGYGVSLLVGLFGSESNSSYLKFISTSYDTNLT
ncbi:hypothetical protein LOD99_11972 [Oopsacas minuta]|uniref:Cytosol aminopeptidase domain-containing protein n=1 Tax=Oopsacas minuta TaxID=111878 RepID=A0AAV7JH20_9METZ|nr:hypothetical protein LOD99_11972 [Oopsacas minuta]